MKVDVATGAVGRSPGPISRTEPPPTRGASQFHTWGRTCTTRRDPLQWSACSVSARGGPPRSSGVSTSRTGPPWSSKRGAYRAVTSARDTARTQSDDVVGLRWRRRTGIEPARELVAPSSVLKTAGPTRNPDASTPEDSGAGSEASWCTVAHVTEPAPPKQRHIALILAKDLAANLADPLCFCVDAAANLVFFNEAGRADLRAVPTPRRR